MAGRTVLGAAGFWVVVEPRSGAVALVRLAQPGTEFVAPPAAGAGLQRFALQMDDRPGHHVAVTAETGETGETGETR